MHDSLLIIWFLTSLEKFLLPELISLYLNWQHADYNLVF